MRQIRGLICIMLSLLIVVSASCGDNDKNVDGVNLENQESISDTINGESTKTALELMPDTNYGGRTFNMLTAGEYSDYLLDQISVEELNGDVVNDAYYYRNLNVETKYNVKITPREIPYNDLITVVRQEIMSGEQNTDIILHSPTQLAALVPEKLFIDINELPYTDLDADWYVPGVNKELAVSGKQYLFLTDLGAVYTYCCSILQYNRDLATELGMPDLHQIVLDGGWTIDKMIEYSRLATYDLNGDGFMDNQDRYGTVCMWSEFTDTIPYSMGIKITENDAKGKPQLVFNNERMVTCVEKMLSLMYEGGSGYTSEAADDTWKTPQEMFRDNKALFVYTSIVSLQLDRFRDMEADHAVLPLPKLDETQERYLTGTCIGSATVYAVPITTPDTEFTSRMIEAISAEGKRLVIPAYIDTAIKIKHSSDETSKEIYDLILDGRIIDFATIYDSDGMYLLFRQLMKDRSPDFTSAYYAAEPAALEKYDRIYTSIITQ